MTQPSQFNGNRYLQPTPMEESDWSQWMQWDWDDTSPGAISKSDIDYSDLSPNSGTTTLRTIDNTELISDPLFPASNARQIMANPSRLQPGSQGLASLARRRNNGGAKADQNSSRKRKTSSEDDDGSIKADDSPPESKPQPSKKRSHNVVEKRYRANLNEKIGELRDSIPSLRGLTRDINGGASTHDDDFSSGNKLNKASILSKATEYIRHLELRNRRLEEENQALKARLRQLDKAVIIEQSASISVGSASSPDSYSGTIDSIESPPSVFSHTEDSPHSRKTSTSNNPPEGMIKVPDYIKKMRAMAPPQGIFAESYIKDGPKPQQQNGQVRRGMTPGGKLFLGTIAGLMVLQNLPAEKESDSTEKGLLAVPLNVLNDFIATTLTSAQTNFLVWTQDLAPWSAWQFKAGLSLLLTVVLVVGSAFFVFLYLFYARPRSENDSAKIASASGIRMTPAEIKRQAWLTSMQRLGVPQHRFFLEWFAVTSRWVEYSVCCLVGRSVYSWITGITEEDEKGRIKTWDIAIDAQLAGGDTEVSKSRLVLTIFASGTLPRSPARIMLKAFHCRILLWRVGQPGSFVSTVANHVGRVLATYQWNLARELNRSLPKDHPDALPSHLSALVETECNDVLIDPIVQRAVNLTWSRPTQEGLDEDEALLDVVAEDPAVQTFADSIAAWWSSHVLQTALLNSFNIDSDGGYGKKKLEQQINLALQVAPRLSAAHTRAAAMRAVLYEQNRLYDIKTVLNALPSKKAHQRTQEVSNFLDSSIPMSVRNELAISVRCAMIAAIIRARTTNDTTFPSHLTIRKAINWLNQLPLDPLELTLISFTAVYHLLHSVVAYGDLLSTSASSSSPSATSSDFSISTTKSAPPPSSSSLQPDFPSPQTHKRVRSNSASEPTPQYSRIANDLVYWARNAYNPAFYGLTGHMVDTVEAECVSICKNVGIDLMAQDSSKVLLQTSIRRLINNEERGKYQKHGRAKTGSGGGKEEKGDYTRRKSLESNDTGYASDSR
ncbi:HLH transcription factor, putative [Talaromyces stipitatus ATCC 10500]|uniref:HLH transcription factor, putative n=1 Tax=Talaromyces stipitatus (strain ATCC 10500 / CBS 375.48 / QM 6759 / NRRL 1006) TaxID=441959 RepID=B8M5D2_TALSN|nr:HLH transcription factor, putative [Talaromyces stipitatus ATCC 10500]EED19738.1 HLH transcription factor, putative [Talaromyces stipitatus ATCC 10500]